MPAVEGTGVKPLRIRPSARAVAQVMTALKNSKSENGPTMTEIVKFISTALLNPATKRQVLTALKRSVEFGILKRRKGHYFISSPEEHLEVPIEKVRGIKTKLDKVKRHRGAIAGTKARRPSGKLQDRRYNSDYQESLFELCNVYRNPSYRTTAVSSTTTLYKAYRDLDFE